MRFDIITLFPEMFQGIFTCGILGKAIEKRLVSVNIHNLRDYARDKHHQVDDRPFGGSPGMVFKPEPVFAAVEHIQEEFRAPVYLLSPRGRRFDSDLAREIAKGPGAILLCGRYEGVDERVVDSCITEEISIGDYILSGGEPAALVMVDSISRFVPQVVGKEDSVAQDSFSEGLLEHPQYTRPREFRGMKVPEVLVSGNHEEIARWRHRRSLEKTWRMRPDLLQGRELSSEEKRILAEIQDPEKGKDYESSRQD